MKPQTLITSGSNLGIMLKVKNKDDEVLEDFNDQIYVKINHATYDNFICGEDEDNYCKKATLNTSNKLITCQEDGMSCHVNAKNGIADFRDLILHGQKNKIYNLEFYYEGISSLDLLNDIKRLDTKSSTNHLSQVLIYDADEYNNQIYSYYTDITIEDGKSQIKADGKSTVKITADVLNNFGYPLEDEPVTFDTNAGIFENGQSKITVNKDQFGLYSATLTSSNEPGVAHIGLLVGDDETFLDQIKITFDEQILHSFEVENHTCQKNDNKDSNICFISTDKEQETIKIRISPRDQDNKVISNKEYSIKATGATTELIRNQYGVYEYTWDINQTDNKEIKFYHDNVELIIAALNKPKWRELTNCFDSHYRKYISLKVGQILGNHINPKDDVAINFSVDTGLITQPNNRFGNNTEINIKCVLGEISDESGENSNEIIWQISKEDYDEKWPNMPQITASVTIEELKFEVKAFVPITKTSFLDWPINRLISTALNIDKYKKIKLGEPQRGAAKIDENIIHYQPDDEKAHKSMLKTLEQYHKIDRPYYSFFEPDLFNYNISDDALFDRLPIIITLEDESQINTYLHIKFTPDKRYDYQHHFKEFISENAKINDFTGINLHKAIISKRADGKVHKGYSGDGVTVAIAGDGIFHHQELDEIIKLDLIEPNGLNKGIAEESVTFPNNTNIAGIIASQVNESSNRTANIRGISPNVELVNIAIVNTSYTTPNNPQKADRDNIIKLLSDTDATDLSPNHEYQKISNETNKYSPYKSLKTSDINLLNLNFTLSKSKDFTRSDEIIEEYIWDATSRKYNFHTDKDKEVYKTKFGNTIFVKGLDFYTKEKSALISNHPAIINVVSYNFRFPNIGNISKANWISVPISTFLVSICRIKDDTFCQNFDTSTEFPDRNQKSGYRQHSGNSAASAVVTGVIALMLEANPELTWRDIKYILANTAKVNEILNMEKNNAGYKFDARDNYGFGFIDAEAAVKMASTHKKELGDLQVIKSLEVTSTNVKDREHPTSKIEFTIDEDIKIEAITLTYIVQFINTENSFKNLRMTVEPPSQNSKLLTIPSYPYETDEKLKITLNHFYGESAKGNWRFHFKHFQDPEYIEDITMTMTIYGTKEDISKTSNP
jgi:hypothetical protein